MPIWFGHPLVYDTFRLVSRNVWCPLFTLEVFLSEVHSIGMRAAKDEAREVVERILPKLRTALGKKPYVVKEVDPNTFTGLLSLYCRYIAVGVTTHGFHHSWRIFRLKTSPPPRELHMKELTTPRMPRIC